MPIANSINEATTGIVGFTGTSFTATPATQYAVLVGGSTSSTLSNIGPTATAGQVLQSAGNAANPAFSTATFPTTATGTGTLLRADGTNWVATTSTYPNTNAINTLLYASSANVMSALATGNNGVLVTSNTGVPSILAGGTTGQILQANTASAPSFSTATYPSVATGTGTLLRADGTNWVATTTTYPNTNAISTLLYASSANVMSALTTANNGLLVTSSTGVPSILAGPGTTGNILQSNAAAAPSFSTATFPSTATSTGTILRANGTNWVATTATYPTTTTSQQILYSTGTSVIGELTTANSALAATNSSGTLAMRALSVNTQVFTSTGTYTPTTGMLYCIIECIGGGGAGGGAPATTGSQTSIGGGGGAGEYARGAFSASTIGASKSVTIGAAGTANSGATGGNGGNTSVGSTNISANGGSGGVAGTAGTSSNGTGGLGGTGGTGGDFRSAGQAGASMQCNTSYSGFGGAGGSTLYGAGGLSAFSSSAGNAGLGYGAGGSGGVNYVSQSAVLGGVGTKGVVIITEFIIN